MVLVVVLVMAAADGSGAGRWKGASHPIAVAQLPEEEATDRHVLLLTLVPR